MLASTFDISPRARPSSSRGRLATTCWPSSAAGSNRRRLADGRGIVFAVINAGEVFGEIALLDGKERTADAIAVTASNLAILD